MTTIRTQGRALREAQSRWGKTAAVRASKCFRGDPEKAAAGDKDHKPWLKHCTCFGHDKECPGGKPAFTVGRIVMGIMFSVEGEGGTWNQAFARADWKKHDDEARYSARPCCDWGKDTFCTEGLRLLRAAGITRKSEREQSALRA